MTARHGQPGLELARVARWLSRSLRTMRPGAGVTCVYNPLNYAWEAHATYLAMARLRPRALLLGMNPGPYGMVQTGVPFGEVEAVRAFLGIHRGVRVPRSQHAKRPVTGFACTRSEVSGRRFWGLMRDEFGTPARFFAAGFVWNWCPLAFMAASGANVTPDKLSAGARASLERTCDAALARVVAALQPRMIIGVGAFARDAAVRALGRGLPVHMVLHPSPASPAANRGWDRQARAQLRACGFLR